MKPKIIIITVIALLLLSGISLAKGQYKTIEAFFDTIPLLINGQESSTPIDSIIYQGAVYLPIRSIGQSMGGEVTWNNTKRAVEIDFVVSHSDWLIAAANQSIFQYVATEKNQIMVQMISSIKNNNMNTMKLQVERLQKLEDLASNLEDDTMRDYLEKMAFSAEIIRSGLQSKTGQDYILATQLFAESEKALTEHIKSKLTTN